MSSQNWTDSSANFMILRPSIEAFETLNTRNAPWNGHTYYFIGCPGPDLWITIGTQAEDLQLLRDTLMENANFIRKLIVVYGLPYATLAKGGCTEQWAALIEFWGNKKWVDNLNAIPLEEILDRAAELAWYEEEDAEILRFLDKHMQEYLVEPPVCMVLPDGRYLTLN